MYRDFMPTLPSLLEIRGKPLIHRDLSWVQFNERVLAQAKPGSHPLLERLKFLSITASNLDEFFMVRLASLERTIRNQKNQKTADGRSRAWRLVRIRNLILETINEFNSNQAETFERLVSELAHEKIYIVKNLKENAVFFNLGRGIFERQVLPNLLPPEVFSTSKVEKLENLAIAALFRETVLFQIPKTIPTVFSASRGGCGYLFLLDALLTTYLGDFFQIRGPVSAIRVTRDSDFNEGLDLTEDTESIPDTIRSRLREGSTSKRGVVRLQYLGALQKGTLEKLAKTLNLTESHLMFTSDTLCLRDLWMASNHLPKKLLGKKLLYPPLAVCIPRSFRRSSGIFEKIREHDYLLHHPYDSFDVLVAWIRHASLDPAVEMIEQTIYRMDVASPIIDILKEAAKHKKIRVFIELRARFDELNNLALAEMLKKAGVEVAFGFGRLKLHAKMTLVTRKELGCQTWYTHLSTGNYNATTARQYTDLAILTANQEMGADARHFFDSILKAHTPRSFKHLVLAPIQLHKRLITYIQAEQEAAKNNQDARIVAKVNALIDEEVISNLYLASQAGVKIDLIVRGACSLIPGILGLSENIRVISVVDRFLEHSRIYYFGHSKIIYLSSADWMPRNFFSRLETAFPILDRRNYAYLEQVVIPTYLADTQKARELTPQGIWKKRTAKHGTDPIRSQQVFEKLARNAHKGTALERVTKK